jgi:general secretion pathway protein A
MRRGAGFLLLSGEIGAGKTTVCRHFLRELPPTVDVAFIVNPRLDARSLLIRICEDLRIPVPPDAVDLIDLIHGHLLLAHAEGRRTLIVVDEAQALSNDVLEQLRLLTNLDATGSKLQVFLIGQPELRTLLRDPVLAPVAQRIVGRFHLSPLEEAQTATYLAHRLRVAGLSGPLPFDEPALRAIHRLARGIPRSINVLCDQALVAADADSTWAINEKMIERIAGEVFDNEADDEPRPVPSEPGEASTSLPPTPAELPAPVSDSEGGSWSRYAMLAVAALVLATIAAGVFFGRPLLPASSPKREDGRAPQLSRSPAVSESDARAALTAASADPASPPEPNSAPVAPPALAPTLGSAPASAPVRSDFDAVFAAADTDEAVAWHRLGLLWGATLGNGSPCYAAGRLGLRCYNANGGLAIVRQLNRPGILKVSNGEHTAYLVLVGLTPDTATFRNDKTLSVPTSSLARHWHGEFATLWRAPPGYHDNVPNDPALQSWVGQQLSIVDRNHSGPGNVGELSARIAALQLTEGLKPDGVAGPLTLMQLNRAVGVEEPTLSAGL